MSARRQPKLVEVVESSLEKPARIVRKLPRRFLWAGGIFVGLLLLLLIASLFVDEPMRRSMERAMNRKLIGYTVVIPELDFHLIGLSVTLKGLTVRQQAHPEPAVAIIPRLKASVQWKELLTLHLVADFEIDEPRVHINLPQLRAEDRDPVPVNKKGWQDAVQAIYPLKINLLRVNNGDFTYIDEDPKRPLRLTRVQMRAENIRNIHAKERDYPSPIYLDAVVFDTGHARVNGHANFLAKPHPAVHTLFDVQNIPLDRFRPILARNNLSVRGGILSTNGRIEYSAPVKVADVKDVRIRNIRIDHIHTGTKAQEQRGEKIERAAREASNKPGLLLRLKQFHIEDSEVGLINRAKEPDYRVFLSNTNLEVTNLSNQFRDGPAKAKLTGKFMGSGSARATATFRPEEKGPDFDLNAVIEGTQMKTMNDFLRAYGKFDVVAGVFSLYSEIHVKNRFIQGYVKPVFEDLDVYDPEQDKKKSIFKKVYEGVVGGVSKILENKERDEVVTVANISGPVSNPDSSTWEIIGKLIQNAFFEAILPGFEREAGKKR